MGKGVVVAGVVGVAAVALVGASYIAGGRVETGFREAVAAMNTAGLQVRIIDYRRGVFAADARTMWSVVNGDEPVDFSVRHDIGHGPLTLASGARINSILLPPEEFAEALATALQGRALLEVLSVVGWSGASSHRITSPTYEGKVGEGLDLAWGGVRGDVNLSADGRHARGSIEAPALSVRDVDGNLLSVGRVALTLDSVRPAQYRFWTGPSALSVERVSYGADGGAALFEIDGFRLGSSAAIEGEVVNLGVDLAVKRAAGNGETFEDLGFDMVVERIDAAALDAIAGVAEDAGREAGSIEEQQARLMSALLQQLPVLLSRSPAIDLKRAGARLVEGPAELGVRVAYSGQGEMAAFNPVSDLSGELRVSLPPALLARLVEAKERESILDYVEEMEIDADPGEIEEAVRAAVGERMAALTGTGLLQEQDGLLRAAMSYKDGAITVNGRPLQPGELGALGLPF